MIPKSVLSVAVAETQREQSVLAHISTLQRNSRTLRSQSCISFSSHKSSHWAEAWADQAYREGITYGCGGSNFCPSGIITRDLEAVFIEATFHLIPPPPTATPIPTNTPTPSPTPTVTVPLGARLTQTFEYYPWSQQGGRLHSLTATGGTQLQNLSYVYDAAGNINSIDDAITGETQTFAYDSLNRLTSALVTNGLVPYSEDYGYDLCGKEWTLTRSLHKHLGLSLTATGNKRVVAHSICLIIRC